MAEFSKEYCRIWDPELPHDFSIEEIAKDLHRGNHYPIICEGLGFVSIGKNNDGNIILAIPSENGTVEWVEYYHYMMQQIIDKENTNYIINNNEATR